MFTFDDLVRLDAGSAQTLMRHIDKDKLAIALKGATEAGARSSSSSNMSTRAAKMLVDDMQAMGPVRLRDVDEAQVLLVNLAKDLAAKGEIIISKSAATKSWSTEMVAPAKYLFDHDFAAGAKAAEKPVAPAEHAVKLGEAESKGFRDGFAAAEKEGTAVAARRTAVALRADRRRARPAGARACRDRSAGSKPKPSRSPSRSPASSRRSWSRASRSPRSRRSPPNASAARRGAACRGARQRRAARDRPRRSSTRSPRSRGFEGRLVVLAEPEIALGDCRIEWADGGVVRDAAKTDARHRQRHRTLSRRAARPPRCPSSARLNQETAT